MLFNSWVFIFFLCAILPVYYSLNTRPQIFFLVGASCFFYGYWDYRFLSLIILSVLLNYFLALRIQPATKKGRKILVVIGLCCNLGFIGFFKYFNFFIDTFSSISQALGFSPFTSTLRIILPLGISFYTFQAMAYIINVYRGDQEATNDFISFALYMCYFPQLLAGPIGKPAILLPAIQAKKRVTKENIFSGIQLIMIGFVKKVAIADAVAPYVNSIYQSPQGQLSIDLLCGVYLFALQIYGDFSGYSDIARGVSKFMGIELMVNFRQPYFSKNVVEFWRRWHISLSEWLRDYLYISLGGNRRGKLNTYRNLIITMLLGGLWHGASWVFVFWGCLHGVYLAVHRLITDLEPRKRARDNQIWNSGIISISKMLFTFHLIAFAWVFFRSPNVSVAVAYLSRLFNTNYWIYPSHSYLFVTVFYLSFVFLLDLPLYRSNRELLFLNQTHWVWRSAVYVALILIISFVGESYVQPFIYFQF